MSAEDIEYMYDYKEFPTKESALDWLDNYLSLNERNNLIRALEQEPCEDCISRQAVLDYIVNVPGELTADGRGMIRRRTLEEYISDTLLPVIPQPKTGHWIVNEHGSIYCSECGCGALYDKVYPGESVFGKAIRVKSTFCPTCGAKMVVPQESEDKE